MIRDSLEQIAAFDVYIEETADLEDRQQSSSGAFGYAEAEWEAFQYGWNAALASIGELK